MAAAEERRVAGVCLFCVERDGIYVLIGNENIYIGSHHEYDITAHGHVCSATAEFSAVLGGRPEPGARFAPMIQTADGFRTIMRMNAGKYGIPKGGLELDDTPEIAAIREFNEETSTLLPMECMRDAVAHETTTIFLVQVTRDNAERIIASYRTHFAPIRFGELSDLQLCRTDRLPSTNYITRHVISKLLGIARDIPVSDIHIYSAPCTGMWSSIGTNSLELLKNKIVNAVADAIINHRGITDFGVVCDLRRRLEEIATSQHWRFGIVPIFLEFLELLTPEERDAVRHFDHQTLQLLGVLPKEFRDAILAGIHRTDAKMDEDLAVHMSRVRDRNNAAGGKRTQKHRHRKRQTRRNKKLRV